MLRYILAFLLVTLLALQAVAAPSIIHAEGQQLDVHESSSIAFEESPLNLSSDLSEAENHTNCAEQRPTHGISKGVASLLHHLEPYLGEDRVARYTEHVQSAMGWSEESYLCDEKVEVDEKVDQSVDLAVEDVDIGSTYVTEQPVELDKAPNGLILALGVLAAVLGVAGLLACLKRRCCSLRRRVERLADREERLKAREYRIAARQESRRRFLLKLRRAFTSCFTGGSSNADEEKAALVINAAEQGRSEETLEEAQAHMRGVCYVRDVATQLQQQAILETLAWTRPQHPRLTFNTRCSAYSIEPCLSPLVLEPVHYRHTIRKSSQITLLNQTWTMC